MKLLVELIVKLVQIVVHVLFGTAIFVFSGCEESSPPVVEESLSLEGVVFRIPDRESLVLPSNYVLRDGAKKAAKDPTAIHLVTNFTLCAKLPEIEFRGDRAARSGCLSIGYKGNERTDWLRMDVEVTPGTNWAGLERGLGKIMKRVLSDIGSNPTSRVEYVKGNDAYGLHSYQPIGPNIRPSTDTLFYRGKFDDSVPRVEALIQCWGSNSGTTSGFIGCTHSYVLAVPDRPSWGARVKLYYNGAWLDDWAAIEMKSREKILSLRIQQNHG